jgi:anti-anti-sigma regulatory factor
MLEFTIRVFPQRVAINGELDIATAPEVDAALALLTGDVDVDCTDLSFIDSSGFYSLDHGYEVR